MACRPCNSPALTLMRHRQCGNAPAHCARFKTNSHRARLRPSTSVERRASRVDGHRRASTPIWNTGKRLRPSTSIGARLYARRRTYVDVDGRRRARCEWAFTLALLRVGTHYSCSRVSNTGVILDACVRGPSSRMYTDNFWPPVFDITRPNVPLLSTHYMMMKSLAPPCRSCRKHTAIIQRAR